MMRGIVSDIQKFSLHDGPGIRTTIFLKGCTLHCQWCHNPEAIALKPELMRAMNKCIGCGACVAVCPTGAITREDDGLAYHRALCRNCFACVRACPSAALSIVGTEMEAEDVVACAMADRDYYESSGGGITLSGGDPVMQSEFAAELLRLFHEKGVHTAMESALNADEAAVDRLTEHLDLLFFDVKLLDEKQHLQYTGASNRTALAHVKRLSQRGLAMVARTPLIPGVTDTVENVTAIAAWLHENAPQARYQLLNYNPMAEAKWENIGLSYPIGKQKPLSAQQLDELCAAACEQGVDCFWEQE